MEMRRALGILTTLVVLTAGAQAKEIVVCPVEGDGCDYTSIQEAIDNAKNGDTILLRKGVYNEHDVTVKNKCIDIKGEGGSNTVINAEGMGRGMLIYMSNIPNDKCEMKLSNFQIRNGSADNGGGIYIYQRDYDSGALLDVKANNLLIIGNTASQDGGGVYVYGGSGSLNVALVNTKISKNTASADGGGVYQNGGELTLKDSVVEGNTAIGDGGGLESYGSDSSLKLISTVVKANNAGGAGGGIMVGNKATIIKSWIIKNVSSYEGGGIDTHDKEDVSLSIYSSVIAYNEAGTKGGGICLGSESHSYGANHSGVIKSSTIYGNSAKEGSGIFVASGYNNSPVNFQLHDSVLCNGEEDLVFEADKNGNSYGNFIVKYNALCSNVDFPSENIIEEGNFVKDSPGFTDPENFDFSLTQDSPLIDKGDDGSSYLEDIAGSLREESPDIGACEYPSKCKLDELVPATPSLGSSPCSDNFTKVTVKVNFWVGWNLAGVPSFEERTIADIFGDKLNSVYTLWKWDRGTGKWELYTSDEKIKNYVESFPVSIDLLDEGSAIKPGEGFWVKAKNPFELEFRGYEPVK